MTLTDYELRILAECAGILPETPADFKKTEALILIEDSGFTDFGDITELGLSYLAEHWKGERELDTGEQRAMHSALRSSATMVHKATRDRALCPDCERESPYENHGWICTHGAGCVERAANMRINFAGSPEPRGLPTPDPFKFAIGQRVEKFGGSYQLSGEIAARWLTDKGEPRYVVNHKPIAPGLLHIYGEAQLREETPGACSSAETVAKLTAERDEARTQLGGLLARINGDGGSKQEELGTDLTCIEADRQIVRWLSADDDIGSLRALLKEAGGALENVSCKCGRICWDHLQRPYCKKFIARAVSAKIREATK